MIAWFARAQPEHIHTRIRANEKRAPTNVGALFSFGNLAIWPLRQTCPFGPNTGNWVSVAIWVW